MNVYGHKNTNKKETRLFFYTHDCQVNKEIYIRIPVLYVNKPLVSRY